MKSQIIRVKYKGRFSSFRVNVNMLKKLDDLKQGHPYFKRLNKSAFYEFVVEKGKAVYEENPDFCWWLYARYVANKHNLSKNAIINKICATPKPFKIHRISESEFAVDSHKGSYRMTIKNTLGDGYLSVDNAEFLLFLGYKNLCNENVTIEDIPPYFS